MTIDAVPGRGIALGCRGEHNARQIRFDLSAWQAEHGAGWAQLLIRRPGESQPYPAAQTEMAGSSMLWTVTRTDTHFEGDGEAQLLYFVADALVKQAIYTTWVDRALGESDAPEPLPSYLEQITQVGAKVQQDAAQTAEDRTQTAENAKQTAIDRELSIQNRLAAASSAQEAWRQSAAASAVANRAKQEAAAAEQARSAAEAAAQKAEGHESAVRTLADGVTAAAQQVEETAAAFGQQAQDAQTALVQAGQDERAQITVLAADKTAAFAQLADSAAQTVTAAKDAAAESAGQAAAEAEGIRASVDDTVISDTALMHSLPIFRRLCPRKTAEGTIAALPALVETTPLETKLTFAPIQQGTGDPSPENVRPITGRDKITVIHCGKNLFTYKSISKVGRGEPYNTVAENSITINYNVSQHAQQWWNMVNPLLIPGKTYTIKGRVVFGNTEKRYTVSFGTSVGRNFDGEQEFTVTARWEKNSRIAMTPVTPNSAPMTFTDIQISEEDIPYQPNQSEGFTIQLGQEVYGGTVDLQTGEGFITYGTWTAPAANVWSDYIGAGVSLSTVLYGFRPRDALCTNRRVLTSENTTGTPNTVTVEPKSYRVYLPYKTREELVAALTENPCILYLPLAKPTPFHLTPDQLHQLRAYGGTDTVYTSDPDCTVQITGLADPIALDAEKEKRIAALEAVIAQV